MIKVTKDLAKLRAAAKTKIDADAKGRHPSWSVVDEVRAAEATVGTGPLIAAEATARNVTVTQIATEAAAARTAWIAQVAAIETKRFKAHATVDAAKSVADIDHTTQNWMN